MLEARIGRCFEPIVAVPAGQHHRRLKPTRAAGDIELAKLNADKVDDEDDLRKREGAAPLLIGRCDRLH